MRVKIFEADLYQNISWIRFQGWLIQSCDLIQWRLLCVLGYKVPLFYVEQHTSLINLKAGGYFTYSPLLQFFMVFSFSEFITWVIFPLAATDDNSDKDSSPVGWVRLSFTVKYLHNEILTHVKQLIWVHKQATYSKILGN